MTIRYDGDVCAMKGRNGVPQMISTGVTSVDADAGDVQEHRFITSKIGL